jgi:hypothetical protein
VFQKNCVHQFYRCRLRFARPNRHQLLKKVHGKYHSDYCSVRNCLGNTTRNRAPGAAIELTVP